MFIVGHRILELKRNLLDISGMFGLLQLMNHKTIDLSQ